MRSWEYDPPQLPDAPIEIWTPIGKWVALLQDIPPEFNIVRWKPLGIYRQEFFDVCGRWE